jgi:hypothetical protein
VTLKSEKGGPMVTTIVKKSGLESRLIEFFPPSNQQQTEENFIKTFNEYNLVEVVSFRKLHAAGEARNTVYRMIKEAIEEERNSKEIIYDLKECIAKNQLNEQDAISMVNKSFLIVNIKIL